MKVFISTIIARQGVFANRPAPGAEKDLFPRLLFEVCHQLIQDVRSDALAAWIRRFQQGADPRERPVVPAEPIYGVEVHVLEESKASANGAPWKFQAISMGWSTSTCGCKNKRQFFPYFLTASEEKKEKVFTLRETL